MRAVYIMFIVGCFFSSCSWYPHDNALEEFTEDVIQDKTGVKIDFTGSSPE